MKGIKFKKGMKIQYNGNDGRILDILNPGTPEEEAICIFEDEFGALITRHSTKELTLPEIEKETKAPRKKRLSGIDKINKDAIKEKYQCHQVDVLVDLFCDYLKNMPIPDDIPEDFAELLEDIPDEDWLKAVYDKQ